MRSRWTPYLFLTPFMAAFTLFLVIPVGYAMYLSLFVTRRVIGGPARDVFGGLANYARALQDTAFLTSLLNVLKFGLVQIPIMLGVALVIALILEAGRDRLRGFLRVVVYLPYTFPGVVAGLAWGFLYNRDISPLPQVLGALHLPFVNLLAPGLVLTAIGNIVTWSWTGYNAITLYSALQGISTEMLEAAKVDGATDAQVIWRIKLPLLRPALQLTLMFSIIGTMQIFAEPFVLRATTYVADNITPNSYLYLVAARDNNFSYAAALAILLALVTFLFSAYFLRTISRTVD